MASATDGLESKYEPTDDQMVLEVTGFDRRIAEGISGYIEGRGFYLVDQGDRMFFVPEGFSDTTPTFPTPNIVRQVNEVLIGIRGECRNLVWKTVKAVTKPMRSNARTDEGVMPGAFDGEAGTKPVFVGVNVRLLPEEPVALAARLDELAKGSRANVDTPLVPILDIDTPQIPIPEVSDWMQGEQRPTDPDGLPDELVNLERGKFVVLDGKTLVVNVEGFSDDTIENLRNSLLILEIPGVEGGVNDRSVLILPTIIGNLFYFEFNELVDPADSELIKNIASIVETELVLFEAWQKA